METVLMLSFIFIVNTSLGAFFYWAWLEYKAIEKELK